MKKVLFLGIFLTIILIGTQFVNAAPNSAIVPGAIRTDASFNHIGAVWEVSGDTNQNSQMSLEFRKQGASTWQDGAMAMRAYPTLIVNGSALNKNYWAASAMFLEEDTTYELRLSITDPDGGNQTQTVSATTRSWPQPDAAGRQLYVVPGNGGGDGSLGNPFKGLQAAANAAQAGDWFHVAAGNYSAFELTADGTDGHPIAFVGPEDKTAVIDGGNTNRGVVTLASSNHVILQGFTIQNGYWGIDAQHTQNIYIHHNTIQDVGFGIYNRRQSGLELNQTVCDNVLTGRTTWPNTGIPSERGIDLRGTGNVVCHNTVRNFGDCISV